VAAGSSPCVIVVLLLPSLRGVAWSAGRLLEEGVSDAVVLSPTLPAGAC